jgi:hypothetical protein
MFQPFLDPLCTRSIILAAPLIDFTELQDLVPPHLIEEISIDFYQKKRAPVNIAILVINHWVNSIHSIYVYI